MSRVSSFQTGRRVGVTLIELLVALAILGVVSGLAGLAFRGAHPSRGPASEVHDRIAAVRHEAITNGQSVTITVMVDERPHAVAAFADGRVVTDLPRVPDSSDRHLPPLVNPGVKP